MLLLDSSCLLSLLSMVLLTCLCHSFPQRLRTLDRISEQRAWHEASCEIARPVRASARYYHLIVVAAHVPETSATTFIFNTEITNSKRQLEQTELKLILLYELQENIDINTFY